MYVNGIVIQSFADSRYKGIDGSGFSTGENWFFNSDESTADIFGSYYDENIGKTYWNLQSHSWIAACNDMDYIYQYIKEAEKRGIKYRLLLCETEVPDPIFACPDLEKKFLGYDYAYETGTITQLFIMRYPMFFRSSGLINTVFFRLKRR